MVGGALQVPAVFETLENGRGNSGARIQEDIPLRFGRGQRQRFRCRVVRYSYNGSEATGRDSRGRCLDVSNILCYPRVEIAYRQFWPVEENVTGVLDTVERALSRTRAKREATYTSLWGCFFQTPDVLHKC